MRNLKIGNRLVGLDQTPFMVAEISANHGGDLERAKRIARLCAEAGADAIKFQYYTADSLTLDVNREDFTIRRDGLWHGERLYDLYQRAATSEAWFPELFNYCHLLGVLPFASVFDLAGIEAMEALNVAFYKIASFEAVELELIAACARTGKPLILSTGLCSKQEIHDAVRTFREAGGEDLVLLRCSSDYPADPTEANLVTIPDMAEEFGCIVGYSDHTLDAVQSIVAVALGACVIEKHVIDAREPATPDSAFSSLPDQYRELVHGCRAAHLARGGIFYGPTPKEEKSLVFRRSLYVSRAAAAGAMLTRDNVRSVRPGFGLAPKHLAEVLGRSVVRDIEAGEPVSWDMLA